MFCQMPPVENNVSFFLNELNVQQYINAAKL